MSTAESEDRLPTLHGRAVCFGLELATAHILDESHRHLPPADARVHLFAAVDATLGPRLGAGDVVVTEELTGSAGTTAPAIAALAAAGVIAVVARCITDDVITAIRTHDLVVLLVDTPTFLHTDDRVRLDLEAAKIVNLSSGDRTAIRNLDEHERTRLRASLARRPVP